jgi:hypothetical protein
MRTANPAPLDTPVIEIRFWSKQPLASTRSSRSTTTSTSEEPKLLEICQIEPARPVGYSTAIPWRLAVADSLR